MSRTYAADEFSAIHERMAELAVDRQYADAKRAQDDGCTCDWLIDSGGLVRSPTPAACPVHADAVLTATEVLARQCRFLCGRGGGPLAEPCGECPDHDNCIPF